MTPQMNPRKNPVTFLLRGLVRTYQLLLSPLFPASCRHVPSCSRYAMDALTLHGALKGGWLATKRIFRCQPWGTSGYDPVPGTDPAHDADKADCGHTATHAAHIKAAG